jgi:hypothetical protein
MILPGTRTATTDKGAFIQKGYVLNALFSCAIGGQASGGPGSKNQDIRIDPDFSRTLGSHLYPPSKQTAHPAPL